PFRSDTIRRGIGIASLRRLRAVGRFSGPRPFRPQRVGRGTGPESIPAWVGMFETAAPRMGVVRSAAVAPAWVLAWIPTLLVAVTVIGAQQPVLSPLLAAGSPVPALLNTYCVGCHDDEMKKGGLDLESISQEDLSRHADAWERVVRKLRAR